MLDMLTLACLHAYTEAATHWKMNLLNSRGTRSEQHEANLLGLELLLQAPVVQVVAQPPVADAKLEVLQEGLVVKYVQGIKDVMSPAGSRKFSHMLQTRRKQTSGKESCP